MNLLSFLLKASKGTVVLSISAGAIAGVAGVGLIALVHTELGRTGGSALPLAWAFVGLWLLSALMRFVAQSALIRLAQRSVTHLCLYLCEKILALPLRQFETINSAALLAILTEDVVIVAHALVGIPLLCINLPVVIACFAYIGWLSPSVLLCALGVAATAIFIYQVLAAKGLRHLMAARAEQDALVGHFRSLIEGFRELKVHRRRRAAFLADCLEASAASVRDRTTAGLTLYAAAGSWSLAAFFGFMGILLFVLPLFVELSRPVLSGSILVVLYVMSPLDVVVTWIPLLGRARASLLRIEGLIPPLEDHVVEEIAAPVPGFAVFHDSLQLTGVMFSYECRPQDGGFSLGPIELTLRSGELVFLTGGNGSGKTTLLK